MSAHEQALAQHLAEKAAKQRIPVEALVRSACACLQPETVERIVEMASARRRRGWRVITTHREVDIRRQSRAHALWRVACDKLEGERILDIEPLS